MSYTGENTMLLSHGYTWWSDNYTHPEPEIVKCAHCENPFDSDDLKTIRSEISGRIKVEKVCAACCKAHEEMGLSIESVK